MVEKKLRVHSNFDELVDEYIRSRLPHVGTPEDVGLQTFSATLQRFTSYSNWRELSSLTYGNQTTPCSIVSSIEFDKDGEVFAVAGVTKKIKVLLCKTVDGHELRFHFQIFNYASILRNVGFQNHYPLREMECDAKLR